MYLAVFLPFGELYGDTAAPRNGENYFGPIILDTPVVLFQKNETVLYVCYYGLRGQPGVANELLDNNNSRPYLVWGAIKDCVAKGHSEGKGAGGGYAPSHAKCRSCILSL